MLSPEIQADILSRYFVRHEGVRKIARECGVTRKTVRALIERRSVLLTRRTGQKTSILDPFKPKVLEFLRRDCHIPVRTIMQHLRKDGYMGGYTILRDWVSLQRANVRRPREAFLSLEFSPGECAQVDWGEFGDVFHDGSKIHCFVMVLCFSRLLYVEFTRSEKFEEFIRCHENAFRYFGGRVPKECWYDNLASAVTDRMGSIIRFNARFMAYMGHHGIRPHACNPARGNEKGRVEDGVKYIRGSFWAGRNFTDFDDICNQSWEWLDNFANYREHRATRKIPALHFEREEKAALSPMNPDKFDTDEVFSRVVPPNYLIHYDTNRYSVPWTLVGMTITVRVSDRRIRIFYNEQFITEHDRSFKKHQKFVKVEHERGLLERKPGLSREGHQIAAVKNIGPALKSYLTHLRSGQRSVRYEVSRILALATIYGEPEVNNAAEELLKGGVIGVDNLELLLKSRHKPLNPSPISFQNQRLNRTVQSVDLRRYDALLFNNDQGETDGEP